MHCKGSKYLSVVIADMTIAAPLTRWDKMRATHLAKRGITFQGQLKTRVEWASGLGITCRSLAKRLKYWPIERALTEPNVTKAWAERPLIELPIKARGRPRIYPIGQTLVDIAKEKRKIIPLCPCCFESVGPYVMGKPKTYCSTACMKRTLVFKAAKHAYRVKRQARKRGLLAESFHPFEVFDRDNWHCRICLMPTPRHMRGTIESNAPELDHIMPLSRGGGHTRSNTQCLCRACNQKKGAALIPPP